MMYMDHPLLSPVFCQGSHYLCSGECTLNSLHSVMIFVIEDTARYAGLLLSPAEGKAFFALGSKKVLFMLFWPILGHIYILEDTARYAEGFGLWPRLLLPFGQKKTFLCCFGPFLAIFGVQ